MKIRYFDHAATTAVKEEVLKEMIPYYCIEYGNASSLYSIGRKSRKILENSREKVARVLNCKPKEIYFTSCGSESDNLAIKGIARKHKNKGKHIITTKIEHPAVLNTCKSLEKDGFVVTYLGVDKDGFISLEELKNSIREDTILISIMFANNEIGTIQPIKEIGEIAKKHNVLFHTDAVQAAGNVPIDVKELNVDLMSMSSHKIYGPKGIGALYIKTGTKLHSFVHGGAQERRRRAGTENMPSIVGYGKAAELAKTNMDEHIERLTSLRTKLIDGILEKIPYTRVNGSLENRLPGNVNFSFEFIEGEGILLMLDMLGIAASSGSACTSGSLDPSHVLMAIGLPHEIAHGSLRLSIGDFTTEEDIDYIIEKLPAVIERLRMMSPLYDAVTKQK